MATDAEVLKRGTGLLIIEAVNSNPNGDPDQESDPRMRLGDIGEISPVSFKRKLRDMIEDPTGLVWQEVKRSFRPELQDDQFQILESRGRDRKALQDMKADEFKKKFWDVRVFGSTFLQKEASNITTGVVQFGMGVSVAPVEIQRLTLTNKAGVEAGKDRGMAPLGYRVVQHGVYIMPFFINSALAHKSGCEPRDIDVLLKLIPYAYSQTASCMRPDVRIRRAWYIRHKSALGSCPDYMLLEALQPVKKADTDKPSSCWEDYEVPADLPAELKARIEICTDLVKPLAAGA
jgi:CRISPR-associated protein Csd2